MLGTSTAFAIGSLPQTTHMLLGLVMMVVVLYTPACAICHPVELEGGIVEWCDVCGLPRDRPATESRY